MEYWFDTEFHERPGSLWLISIGIVCSDGREFYAESGEYRWDRATRWLRENVRPHLLGGQHLLSRSEIRAGILELVGDDTPEFWADHAAYDWVNFCGLFGTRLDLPAAWPRDCLDIQQWAKALGSPTLPEQATTQHQALADAHHVEKRWYFLDRYEKSRLAGRLPYADSL